MKNALLANEKKEYITFEKLSEELSLLPLRYGVECYKIIQSFPKHGRVSYILRGLEFEIEEGIVYFSDADNILLENNTLALLTFMHNSVKKLCKFKTEDDINDPDYYRIEFKDEYNGFIEVHPLL